MRIQFPFPRAVPIVILAFGAFTNEGKAQNRKPVLPDAQIQSDVLRSLAGIPELAGQSINAATTSGVVTLSGSVQDDAQRRRADQIASTTKGVTRVVDELTVSVNATNTNQASGGGMLQSDGSYAPVENSNQSLQGAEQVTQSQQQNGSDAQSQASGEVPPPNGPGTDPYGRPLNVQMNGQAPDAQSSSVQSTQGFGYPEPGVQPPYGPPDRRQSYNGAYSQPLQQGYGQMPGQLGGQNVTLPSGTVLRVRVNQHLSSREVNVGTAFDAMVVNDIVADGQIAIPRGAFVQGKVVDAESSGRLKGRGELGLQLTQVTLGGKTYPIQSDVFSAHGGDKTIQTVNSTLGLGALGAIFGAVAGGGAGAAIGAGVGGAAGLGASAASGRGDVFIPSEAVLSFRLTQPAILTTVSQTEMQRLAYGVPAGEGRGPIVRRPLYAYPYVGPVFYPRYRFYRPYGYYPY